MRVFYCVDTADTGTDRYTNSITFRHVCDSGVVDRLNASGNSQLYEYIDSSRFLSIQVLFNVKVLDARSDLDAEVRGVEMFDQIATTAPF